MFADTQLLEAGQHPGAMPPPREHIAVTTFLPIMTYTRRAMGYEIRCSIPWGWGEDCIRWTDQQATGRDLQSCFKEQIGDALPIITVSLNMSVEDCSRLLPDGALLLLELPANLPVCDADLLARCTAFRAAGFQLGIADYRGEDVWNRSLPLLSYIRFQNCVTLNRRQKELLCGPLRRRLFFIAGNVETDADLKAAMHDGFQLFQGMFAYSISRRHWAAGELQQCALLLERACNPETVAPDLIADVLAYGNSAVHFNNLLKVAALSKPANLPRITLAAEPETLFAEFGFEQLQRMLQIVLVIEMTGSTTPLLLIRFFLQARFHELMRSEALHSPATTARFEGILLSIVAALDAKGAGSDIDCHAFSQLKHSFGLPMVCSAFSRNLEMLDAYSHAQWEQIELLAHADGYCLSTLNDLYHEGSVWARDFVQHLCGHETA